MLATKKLLDFIIKQDKELSEYHSLIKPLQERFWITKLSGYTNDATGELVDFIINWEEHTEIPTSLERLLNENFWIRTR